MLKDIVLRMIITVLFTPVIIFSEPENAKIDNDRIAKLLTADLRQAEDEHLQAAHAYTFRKRQYIGAMAQAICALSAIGMVSLKVDSTEVKRPKQILGFAAVFLVSGALAAINKIKDVNDCRRLEKNKDKILAIQEQIERYRHSENQSSLSELSQIVEINRTLENREQVRSLSALTAIAGIAAFVYLKDAELTESLQNMKNGLKVTCYLVACYAIGKYCVDSRSCSF